MATLQVRGIDEKLYNSLRQRAKNDYRSINQEVIAILKEYLGQPHFSAAEATGEFLKLRWEDSRSAEEIIKDIENSRRNKKNFGDMRGLFN